jgi:hypothetical protein
MGVLGGFTFFVGAVFLFMPKPFGQLYNGFADSAHSSAGIFQIIGWVLLCLGAIGLATYGRHTALSNIGEKTVSPEISYKIQL